MVIAREAITIPSLHAATQARFTAGMRMFPYQFTQLKNFFIDAVFSGLIIFYALNAIQSTRKYVRFPKNMLFFSLSDGFWCLQARER